MKRRINFGFFLIPLELNHTHIPRTSLDLELDLQAQHSKLDFLNDQIAKLQNLKEA